MRETIRRLACFASRLKFISLIGLIFLGGVFLSMGTSAWYYAGIIDSIKDGQRARIAAYDRQVARLEGDIDQCRIHNRDRLDEILKRLEKNTIKLGRTTITANKAAANAKAAASNAASANITVTEIAPAPEKPASPFPKRIEP